MSKVHTVMVEALPGVGVPLSHTECFLNGLTFEHVLRALRSEAEGNCAQGPCTVRKSP